MKIFRSLAEIPPDFGPSVATIGNFDGVHRGHQAVIADLIQRARTHQVPSIAVTFDPHPVRVLHPEVSLRLITPLDEKLVLLAQTGIDATLVLPFTHEFSRLTAREFAQTVLRDALKTVEVQEGENFRFGVGAQADTSDLAALGKEFGFDAQVHKPSLWRGIAVSSSEVRRSIASGDMRAARHLLGHPFEILSTPAPGRGYGARYTVPTVNLAPYHELLPAKGVYITCITIDSESFHSVTNVGNRPTFGADSFAVETHILNFHPIALDEHTEIRLQFLARLRDEIKWPTPEALKAQILRDVVHARRYFSLHSAI